MILLITGPSGAGKSTFITRLKQLDPRLEFSISTTTRPIRDGEIDGRDYDFTVEAEFLKLRDQGAFVEWAKVHGNYYGTRCDQIDRMSAEGKIPMLDIDVQGGLQVLDLFGTTGPDLVSVFLFPPSWEELERRLTHRGTDRPEVIADRLQTARSEVKQAGKYRYWIINDDVEEAVGRMRAVIQAEECRSEAFSSLPLPDEGQDGP